MTYRLTVVLFVLLTLGLGCSEKPSMNEQQDSAIMDMDFRQLVSEADLIYDEPVSRSEAGMPVGNGRMGSLVWTTPSSLKMQINRADVFAMNKSTNSFPRRHTDYASGCGYVDINLVCVIYIYIYIYIHTRTCSKPTYIYIYM